MFNAKLKALEAARTAGDDTLVTKLIGEIATKISTFILGSSILEQVKALSQGNNGSSLQTHPRMHENGLPQTTTDKNQSVQDSEQAQQKQLDLRYQPSPYPTNSKQPSPAPVFVKG